MRSNQLKQFVQQAAPCQPGLYSRSVKILARNLELECLEAHFKCFFTSSSTISPTVVSRSTAAIFNFL